MDIVDFGEDISNFVAFEMRRVKSFKRDGLGLIRSNILVGLVEMALGCFDGVSIILLDVLSSEQWPANEVAGLCGFDPGGFDRVPTHGVHPFDGLFS